MEEICAGFFLDIEKAYAMMWREWVLYKMDNFAIGGNLFNWVNGFLHNRTIQVRVGTILSDEFMLENGTAKGCVISPILFLIAINDLSPKGVYISMFADDMAIWKMGSSVNEVKKRVQKAVKYIKKWCWL